MNSRLRIGLVGCGAMGQGHLGVWNKIPNALVTAVCDGNAKLAEDIGKKSNSSPFSDLESMCASGLIDAVDICTPSGLHGDQALIAIDHRLHVLVEKPLDINLDKVDAVIGKSIEKGVTVGCIFQRRTYSGAREVADLVHAGAMGRILSCSAYVKWHRPQSYYDSAAWRGSWKMDGGVLANQAIHAIDHLCWLAGRVTEVEYAHLSTEDHNMDTEDFAIVVLRYESGARGVIEATTCCNPDLCSRIEIVGTRGSAAFDDAAVVKFGIDGDRVTAFSQSQEKIGGGSSPMSINLHGHEIQMSDFASAVLERRKPMVDPNEARKSVEALHLIYQKAFPGQKVGT